MEILVVIGAAVVLFVFLFSFGNAKRQVSIEKEIDNITSHLENVGDKASQMMVNKTRRRALQSLHSNRQDRVEVINLSKRLGTKAAGQMLFAHALKEQIFQDSLLNGLALEDSLRIMAFMHFFNSYLAQAGKLPSDIITNINADITSTIPASHFQDMKMSADKVGI